MITITNTAKNQIRSILNHHGKTWMFFSIKAGGCNGFNYELIPTNTPPTKTDEVFHDHNLYVCGKSIMYLIGTEIDWKKTIMGEYFHFENPLAKTKCGCGTSFNL